MQRFGSCCCLVRSWCTAQCGHRLRGLGSCWWCLGCTAYLGPQIAELGELLLASALLVHCSFTPHVQVDCGASGAVAGFCLGALLIIGATCRASGAVAGFCSGAHCSLGPQGAGLWELLMASARVHCSVGPQIVGLGELLLASAQVQWAPGYP